MVQVDPREHVDSVEAPMGHISPKSLYYGIFAALIVLTAVTVGAAFLDLGFFNTPIALAIAIIKATLVVLFFMHVRYSTRLTWVVVITALLFLGILFVLTFADYFTRALPTT